MRRTLLALPLLVLPALLLALLPASPASAGFAGGPAIRINEVRLDQPGADNDEYLELRGAPGASLNGLTYVVIGDLTGATPPVQNGGIEYVLDLSGQVLDSNGLFLVAKSTFSLPATPNLIAPLNFENFDNVTHLLVSGFTGAVGQDLDPNDDGVLEITPWTAIIDSVAIVGVLNPDGITNDFFYSDVVVGPDGGAVPGHVYLCGNFPQWRIGPYDITVGVDTPGAANPTCAGGGDGVRIAEIRIDQPLTDVNEYFELVGPAGASLNGLTYVVIGDGAADLASGVIEFVLPLDGLSINANGFFVVAGPNFTLSVPDYVVPDAPSSGFFENGDNVTHLLVSGFTGVLGDDLDPAGNCILATTPWVGLLDSVAFTNVLPPPSSGIGCVYSDVVVGPDGPFLPGHIYRCDEKGGWAVGAFDIAAGQDTPGGPNPPCPKLGCGSPGTAPCAVVQPNPSCYDVSCCQSVCAVDPTCCDVSWDAGCVSAAITICYGSGKPGTVFTYADTSASTLGSGNCATVRNTGIVGGTSGARFFNVQGTNNGNFANWGAVRWNLSEVYAFLDAEATAGGFTNWVIDAVELRVTQSNAAFSAAGPVTAWYCANDATNINPVTASGTLGGGGGVYTGELGPVVQITTWTFTPTTSGDVNAYPILSNQVLSELNDRSDLALTMVFTADAATSATYRGQDAPFTNTSGVTFNAPFLAIDYTLISDLPCTGDLNDDGVVNGADLSILLSEWGKCPGCNGDLNDDGVVNGADLTILLGGWGNCP